MVASSSLCLHQGARVVELDELRRVQAPPPAGRWYPLAHAPVLDRVKDTLGEAGYVVQRQQLALSRGDARFFGTLDLATALGNGVTLAVGVRNSIDKSFPLGFVAGARVFVCDNLAFRSELLVKRKHTRYGEQRFAQAIAAAVMGLGEFQQVEEGRIRLMQHTEVTEAGADSLILRAFEKGIVSAQLLPRVIRQWREPTFADFTARTYWSLLNAFTTVLAERARSAPHEYTVQTMRLSHHLLPQGGEPVHATSA